MTRRLATIMAAMAATTALLATGGCGSTYINVPTLDGSPAAQEPNLPTVRRIYAEALNRVLKDDPPPTERYAIELPEGASDATYWWVLRQLPEGGKQVSRLPEEEEVPPVYRVAQVVVRGLVARAEVVIPPHRWEYERLVTVSLSPDTEGWYANRARTWDIPADQALRIVHETQTERAQQGEDAILEDEDYERLDAETTGEERTDAAIE